MSSRTLGSALVLTLAALMVASSATAQKKKAPPTHSKDAPAKIKKLIKEKKAVMLDVRTPREWNDGHLSVSLHIPVDKILNPSADSKLDKKLDKKKIIYCHCRSGGRALRAATKLQAAGYDVRPLKQGFAELVKSGFAPAKKKAKKDD